MDGEPLVSVVLPCLDESGSVGLVVRQVLDAFAASAMAGEVIVADNGSSDGSADLARAAGATVVDVPVRGYGAAIMGGMEAARGEICVMGDADATYPFGRLEQLVRPVVAGEADMVIGSRMIDASSRTMPSLHRYIGTPMITWLVRRAGGPPAVRDSQSGFRAFRRDAMLGLGLRSTGMEYASEMLVLAGRAGWRVREVNAGYLERIGTSKLSPFADGLRHLATIVLLAPDLALTLPGGLALVAGTLAMLWALVDPAVRQPGTAGWLAAFLAPALLVLGGQGVMTGLLLAERSPLGSQRAGGGGPSLAYRYLIGGSWATGAGLILVAAQLLARLLGFQAPVRASQIEMIALVLVLLGGSALAMSLIARLVDAGSLRYAAPAVSKPVHPAPEDPVPNGMNSGRTEGERSHP